MTTVVVVGGGFAGVAAACRLAGDGYSVRLLERSPRLGGRAASFTDPESGETLDLGHHILMRCCTAAQGFLLRIGAAEAVSFQKSLSIPILCESERSVLRSAPLPGPAHLLPSLLAYRPLSWSERLSTLRADLLLVIGREGEGTFGEWLSRHGQGDRAIRRLWDPISIAALNAPADRVGLPAARHLFREAFFVRGADIGLFSEPLSAIFEAARAYIEARDGSIEVGAGVRRVLTKDGRATGVELADGRVLEADAVIAAVPPSGLSGLVGGLPAMRATLDRAARLEWAPIVNLHLWFDRPVLGDDFAIAVDSPVQAIFDLSHRGHRSLPASHLVLSQSAAEDWIDRPTPEVVEVLHSALCEVLPTIRSARLVRGLVLRHRWATFVPAPGSSELRSSASTPVSGLFLAGDWTATGWPSTIESAVRSGISAAARVEAQLGPPSSPEEP